MDSITTAIIIQLFFRFHPSSSEIVETLVSIREMALVRAASSTRRKKVKPAIPPKPMLANTFGRVINIRDGPACRVSGAPPEKANTAGMIIRPASRAIAVSKISTCLVDASISTSFPR